MPTSSPSFSRSDRYRDWAIYAQDSWKLTPRFTFNYGVRYEHYGVQHNVDPNLDSNFYYGPGATYFDQVRNGSVQIASRSSVGGLWNPRWGTVGPRIGFAWDLFGDASTALRGGWGIRYERNFGNVTYNVIQNPPAYATPQIRNLQGLPSDNLGPFAGSAGTAPLNPTSPRNVDQNINVAQTQFYSLALERRLGAGALFAVEYNGAHGVHLYDIKNINELGGGLADGHTVTLFNRGVAHPDLFPHLENCADFAAPTATIKTSPPSRIVILMSSSTCGRTTRSRAICRRIPQGPSAALALRLVGGGL